MLLAQHIGADWQTLSTWRRRSSASPRRPAAFYVPVEEALDRRAEYRLAEKNVEAQKYRKRMERGKRLPTVGVGRRVPLLQRDGQGRGRRAGFRPGVGPHLRLVGRGARPEEGPHPASMQAENDRLEAREMLAVEIERTWSEVQEAHAQILLTRRSVASAAENLRQNRNFYEAGTATAHRPAGRRDALHPEPQRLHLGLCRLPHLAREIHARHGAVRVRPAFDKYIRQSGGSVVLPDPGCFPRRRMRVAIFSRLHWVMKSALSAASSPISGRIMG